jgi:hypothetical protein
MAALPADKRGALIVTVDEQGNANAQLAAKIGDKWQMAVGIGKPWEGKIEGRFSVIRSW